MTLGQFLKETRTTQGKTLREVEGLTDISNGYLSQLESDLIKQPSPHHLHRLAEVYQVEYPRLMELAGYVPAGQIGAGYDSASTLPLTGLSELTDEDRRKVMEYIEDLRDARRNRGGS